MKSSAPLFLVPLLTLISCTDRQVNPGDYDSYPAYEDAILWPLYTPDHTDFTVWSPVAGAVEILFYESGDGGEPFHRVLLMEKKKGLWHLRMDGDIKGTFYTYRIRTGGKWLEETPGIYATAVGVNGKRAMVADLAEANPEGWAADRGPRLGQPNEAIIYELHVRDMTIDTNSGSSFPGKFLGLTEQGTTGPEGVATGLEHLRQLGITHVHLLPSFDFLSIDESKPDKKAYNWGYDPLNYNVPEGSYSTDPYRPEVRISEFKKMVKAFHDNGIGVILDVVYNHTGRTENSNFNLETPGYYYRHNPDGSFSNASACGNETASERPMMRKFMIESVLYWAKEYHIDGFRFDLMGIHDIGTMNMITDTLKAFNPDILVYGEGWTAGDSPLPEKERALKKYAWRMPGLSVFSDDIRDGLKGSVFEEKDRGFVSGAEGMEESVKFGVVGSIDHDQVNYRAVRYSDSAWASQPWQAISYVSCHDNQTLYDKLVSSAENASPEQIKAMHRLALSVVLTTQGVPFLHAGIEMMRTKGGEHNTYNMPDSVNRIDWQWKVDNREMFDYCRSLIALRKAHPVFSMPDAGSVRKDLRFMEGADGLVAYTLDGTSSNDSWKEVLVCYNAGKKPVQVSLDGEWHVAVSGGSTDPEGMETLSGQVDVPAISMLLCFRK